MGLERGWGPTQAIPGSPNGVGGCMRSWTAGEEPSWQCMCIAELTEAGPSGLEASQGAWSFSQIGPSFLDWVTTRFGET